MRPGWVGPALVVVLTCGVFTAPAAETHRSTSPRIATFSVRDEPVAQVLPAFAEKTGLSVITDATVDGTVSIVLHDIEPREAILRIAEAADILVEDRNGILWMSRLRVLATQPDRWSLRSSGASLDAVVRRLSRLTGRVIHVEGDGSVPISVQLPTMPLERILRELADPLGLTATARGGTYVISPAEQSEPPSDPEPEIAGSVASGSGVRYTVVDGHHVLTAGHAAYRDVLERVFRERDDSFALITPLSATVTDVQVSADNADDLWRRVVAALDIHVVQDKDTWLVAGPRQEHRLAAFRSRAVVTLRNRAVDQVAEVLARIPHLEIEAADHRRNLLIVQGLPNTMNHALEIVNLLETETGGNTTLTTALLHVAPDQILEALRARFPELVFFSDHHRGEVVVTVPRERADTVQAAIAGLDQPRETQQYRTRFADPGDLLHAFGTDHGLDHLSVAADQRSIILRGNAPSLFRAIQLFRSLDRPREQIRYDVSIIQYQNSNSRRHGTQARLSRERSSIGNYETTWDGALRFDQLLSLRFDFLSALGYEAALAITGELSTNEARLVVDTSLRALSGETATLENFSTYRYRDYREHPDEGTALGITREIDSGLAVELTGEVHQDRSISVTTRISISKQGADLTGHGNPPPTSRKVVETTVRVYPGEPIVIGGLLQQEDTGSTRRVPVLGRIPILRRLLENQSVTREETELVLYLSAFSERTEPPEEIHVGQVQRLRKLRETPHAE